MILAVLNILAVMYAPLHVQRKSENYDNVLVVTPIPPQVNLLTC